MPNAIADPGATARDAATWVVGLIRLGGFVRLVPKTRMVEAYRGMADQAPSYTDTGLGGRGFRRTLELVWVFRA